MSSFVRKKEIEFEDDDDGYVDGHQNEHFSKKFRNIINYNLNKNVEYFHNDEILVFEMNHDMTVFTGLNKRYVLIDSGFEGF